MYVSIIVAMDNYRGIGKNNELLCYLPADLKRFKELTSGHTIIMGRRTFESLPNKQPLPNRRNIVITRDPAKFILKNPDAKVDVANSFWKALEMCKKEKEVFAIGGASVYRDALKCAKYMYVTHIHSVFQPDTFFPEFDSHKWKNIDEESHLPDKKNHYQYTFLKYQRK